MHLSSFQIKSQIIGSICNVLLPWDAMNISMCLTFFWVCFSWELKYIHIYGEQCKEMEIVAINLYRKPMYKKCWVTSATIDFSWSSECKTLVKSDPNLFSVSVGETASLSFFDGQRDDCAWVPKLPQAREGGWAAEWTCVIKSPWKWVRLRYLLHSCCGSINFRHSFWLPFQQQLWHNCTVLERMLLSNELIW